MQNHHGGIYQAGNWIYTGKSGATTLWFHRGKWRHTRSVAGYQKNGKKRTPNYQRLPKKNAPGKHRYFYPLDRKMRRTLEEMRRPAPKKE